MLDAKFACFVPLIAFYKTFTGLFETVPIPGLCGFSRALGRWLSVRVGRSWESGLSRNLVDGGAGDVRQVRLSGVDWRPGAVYTCPGSGPSEYDSGRSRVLSGASSQRQDDGSKRKERSQMGVFAYLSLQPGVFIAVISCYVSTRFVISHHSGSAATGTAAYTPTFGVFCTFHDSKGIHQDTRLSDERIRLGEDARCAGRGWPG